MKDNKLFLKSPLKWAGGKSKLMNKIQEVYNNDFFWNSEKYTYIELFGGGGSSWLFVLQNYRPKRVIVNDINPNVINLWRCIQSYPIALCEELDSIISNYNNLYFDWDKMKDFFLDLRKKFNEKKDVLTGTNTNIKMAAEFLFLNKTCFNGLWRTNSKGEFNTPFGKPINLDRNPNIYDKNNIILLSNWIKDVEFICRDYKDVIGDDVIGDVLVYMDPPYRGTWTEYSKESFGEKEQIELSQYMKDLKDRGFYVIQSNSKCNDGFFEEYYKEFEIKTLDGVQRNIRPTAERKVQEILIYNL
jgi:DNA adenine methylase